MIESAQALYVDVDSRKKLKNKTKLVVRAEVGPPLAKRAKSDRLKVKDLWG